jgi:2-isopropylmalate synthase
MNLREKLEIARQLQRLNVDIIEAGFPVISDGDFASVEQIATEIRGPIIAGLARCTPADIDAAGAAVKPAGDRADFPRRNFESRATEFARPKLLPVQSEFPVRLR